MTPSKAPDPRLPPWAAFAATALTVMTGCDGNLGSKARVDEPVSGSGGDAGEMTEDTPGLDPARPFAPVSRDAALRKAKNFLVGLAPSPEEFAAFAEDPAVLPGLVDTWLALSEFEPRAKQMFTLLFQQYAFAEDVGRYFREQNTDIFEQRQGRGGVDLQGPMGDTWSHTVWDIVRTDRPFTEVVTTRTYQMNLPLMTALAYIDATPRDDANLYIEGQSWLEAQFPDLTVSYTQAQQILYGESVDSSSPNFGVFSIGTPDGSAAGSSACDGLFDSYSGRAALEEVFKYIMGAPWRTTCWSWNGGQANMFGPDDLAYRPITLRVAEPGEQRTIFWDLDSLRAADELVLSAEYVGFFGSLGFLANWTTNDANEFRVTANQTLIVGLGRTFNPADINIPSGSPDLDGEHAGPDTPCYGCHVSLDPMRDFFRQSYTYWGSPRIPGSGENEDVPDEATLVLDEGEEFKGYGVGDLATGIANHPRFARAWVEKICDLANAGQCDDEDPEFDRIAEVFAESDFNFKVLLREVLSSPSTTYLERSLSWETKDAAVGTALQDDFCRRLEHRYGITDACGLLDSIDAQPSMRDQIAGAAGVLAQIGYSRGALTPDQPMVPGLFTTAAAELVCETLAGRFFGSGNGLASTVVFEADKKSEAIDSFLTELMAFSAENEQAAELRTVLTDHWDNVLAESGSEQTALQETFALACTAPLTTALGL